MYTEKSRDGDAGGTAAHRGQQGAVRPRSGVGRVLDDGMRARATALECARELGSAEADGRAEGGRPGEQGDACCAGAGECNMSVAERDCRGERPSERERERKREREKRRPVRYIHLGCCLLSIF